MLSISGIFISYYLQGWDLVYRKNGVFNWSLLFIVGSFIIFVMSLRSENQTSAALRVPKDEYTRVMGDILRQPTENVDEVYIYYCHKYKL